MKCNICESSDFKYPSFRDKTFAVYQGFENSPFWCPSCDSYERHRIIAKFLDNIDTTNWQNKNMLVFSHDPCMQLFEKLVSNIELSVYGSENSLDLENIDKPSEQFDIIFHNHVLEHVQNDKKAFSELCRILKPNGIMIWCVPCPTLRTKTIDYGQPNPDFYNHIREYGPEIYNHVMHWSYENKVDTSITILQDDITLSTDAIFLTQKR